MLSNLVTKFALFLLKSNITSQDKIKITSALLEKIHALPMQSIVTFDEQGTISIGGRPLEMEQAISFRESAMAFKDSFARKVIKDQVTYEAIKMGVYQGLNPEMIMFSKAVLYVIQEENKILDKIID